MFSICLLLYGHVNLCLLHNFDHKIVISVRLRGKVLSENKATKVICNYFLCIFSGKFITKLPKMSSPLSPINDDSDFSTNIRQLLLNIRANGSSGQKEICSELLYTLANYEHSLQKLDLRSVLFYILTIDKLQFFYQLFRILFRSKVLVKRLWPREAFCLDYFNWN